MLKSVQIVLLIVISIISIILVPKSSLAQDLDTIALVRISNSHYVNLNTIEFDISIERVSENWIKYVNGTYSLAFDDTTNFQMDAKNTRAYVMKTELKQEIETGMPDIPKIGYRTDFQINHNRLTMTVLGPERYEDCDSVSYSQSLLLATVRIQTTEARLPHYRMTWLKPYDWYQASAFKLENDSLVNNDLVFYQVDDNVSMEDGHNITYAFVDDTTSRDAGTSKLNARYIGQMNSEYNWISKNEYGIVGYTVYRTAEVPGYPIEKLDDVLIATWREGEKYNPDFIANGANNRSITYGSFPDIIEFRGGNYIYSLFGSVAEVDGTINDVFLDSARIPAPRAVIVRARALENPFSNETTIEYRLDDDCYITAYASDLLGKEIKKLKDENGNTLDKIKVTRGTHTTLFRAPELASQGLYNIIITANPILDPTVEVSRAVVKVQLVR